MKNSDDLKNFWENKKVKEDNKKDNLNNYSKKIEKKNVINVNKNLNLNLNNYEIKENFNPSKWIFLQLGLNGVLFLLLFYFNSYLFLFCMILNLIVFWCYTVYKILKYEFKYNKTVWILICIFLPFLTIFFPAFEDEIIINKEKF
jgi:hypothetical protein